MITVRKPDEIYQAHGRIQNGTFEGTPEEAFDTSAVYLQG